MPPSRETISDADVPGRDVCHRAAKVLIKEVLKLEAWPAKPALQVKLRQVAEYLRRKHG